MPLAVRDLINQDSRGIRSNLINLRFFKRMAASLKQKEEQIDECTLFTLFIYCFLMFLLLSDLYLPVINRSNDNCKADTDLILSTFKKLMSAQEKQVEQHGIEEDH